MQPVVQQGVACVCVWGGGEGVRWQLYGMEDRAARMKLMAGLSPVSGLCSS
jgi:hypothetical protein